MDSNDKENIKLYTIINNLPLLKTAITPSIFIDLTTIPLPSDKPRTVPPVVIKDPKPTLKPSDKNPKSPTKFSYDSAPIAQLRDQHETTPLNVITNPPISDLVPNGEPSTTTKDTEIPPGAPLPGDKPSAQGNQAKPSNPTLPAWEPLTKLPLDPNNLHRNFIGQLIEHQPETRYWTHNWNYTKVVCVHPSSSEYDMVQRRFTDGGRCRKYKLRLVERIENPVLLAAFVLRRMEMEARTPARAKKQVITRQLFHATDYHATRAIINENFDYRLAGLSRGTKYGHGTCFTPFAHFAVQFGGPPKRDEHFMLLCHVLQQHVHVGQPTTVIPANECDSTCSHDGKVLVKYHDDTAYPAYRLTFVEHDYTQDGHYNYNYDAGHLQVPQKSNFYSFNDIYYDATWDIYVRRVPPALNDAHRVRENARKLKKNTRKQLKRLNNNNNRPHQYRHDNGYNRQERPRRF